VQHRSDLLARALLDSRATAPSKLVPQPRETIAQLLELQDVLVSWSYIS